MECGVVIAIIFPNRIGFVFSCLHMRYVSYTPYNIYMHNITGKMICNEDTCANAHTHLQGIAVIILS